MAIAEDIYARCRLCTTEAARILTDMINGNTREPIAVHARRVAADIAGDAVYALLGHAFILPIDREDLWLLHNTAECVWYEAEETALLLYDCRQQLPGTCEAVLRATAACCTAAEEMIETFPHPNTVAQELRVLREAQRTCHITMRSCFTDATARCICESAYRVIKACEQLIATLRYAAIKNG